MRTDTIGASIAKLPKWAQDYIARIEREAAAAAETLALRNGENDGGRVVVNPYHDLERITFPDTATVRFNVTGEGWQKYFDVRLKGDVIEVHCGGPMVIFPHVTNVVTMRPVD